MRAKEITRAVKSYDPALFAMQMPNGRIDLYRQNRESLSPPHFLFSLTDDWTPQGQRADWGVEPVLNRLKAHDLWRDDTFVERWIKDEEKRIESSDRARRNSIESFLYDFRSQFKKSFNDVNTASMDKIYPKGNL